MLFFGFRYRLPRPLDSTTMAFHENCCRYQHEKFRSFPFALPIEPKKFVVDRHFRAYQSTLSARLGNLSNVGFSSARLPSNNKMWSTVDALAFREELCKIVVKIDFHSAIFLPLSSRAFWSFTTERSRYRNRNKCTIAQAFSDVYCLFSRRCFYYGFRIGVGGPNKTPTRLAWWSGLEAIQSRSGRNLADFTSAWSFNEPRTSSVN